MSSIRYQSFDQKIHTIDYSDGTNKKIRLSGKKIQKIIKINGLTNRREIDLSRNRIYHIEGFDDLTTLQQLDLSENWIANIRGLEQLTSLRHLYLSNNQIIRITGLEQLTDLQQLTFNNNQITCIVGLEQLSALQYLNLSGNQITHITGLEHLPSLQHLLLGSNQITHIRGLEQLTYLQHLDLTYNQITHIRGLERLTALQYLDLSENKITHIRGLERLSALDFLDLSENKITRIEGMNNLTSLRDLDLSGNKISRIEGINNLTNLQRIGLINNPIKIVPITIMLLRSLLFLDIDVVCDPIIQRFLVKNRININRTVYDDPQNVHDSQINRSITQSLYSLMEHKLEISEEKVIGEILVDPILTKQVKEQIIEYARITDVHSSLCVTFSEALSAVWQIIRTHKDCDEIKRILNQEIDDSYCRCFTGRLSRLINCLNGYDQRVVVRISDQQEIANLIISIRQKTDNLSEQQQMVRQEMTERGYDQQTVEEWLGYLE
jgi:Leucine-rich repeat (LRR) protein